MTPIFKRYFKKYIIFSVIVIMALAVMTKRDMSKAEKGINEINALVTANNVDRAFFENKGNASFFEDYAENDIDNAVFANGMYLQSNELGVSVPELRQVADSVISENIGRLFGCGFAAAVSFAVYAFVYERRKKTASFVGALPYKRGSMFADKWLAGFIAISLVFLADYIIAGLWLNRIMPVVNALDERLLALETTVGGFGRESANCGRMIWSVYLVITALYTLVMFAQNLFGKPVYASLTVAVALFGAFGFLRSVDVFCNRYDLYAVSSFGIKVLDKLENIFLNTPVFTVIALIVIALLFAGGYVLSRAAYLERAGSVFMFKPVKYLVYAVLMLEGAFVFYGFSVGECSIFAGTLLRGLIFLAVGAVITMFALNKLFSLEVEI